MSLEPREARRSLEELGRQREPAVCEAEQELAREPEQQPRLPHWLAAQPLGDGCRATEPTAFQLVASPPTRLNSKPPGAGSHTRTLRAAIEVGAIATARACGWIGNRKDDGSSWTGSRQESPQKERDEDAIDRQPRAEHAEPNDAEVLI